MRYSVESNIEALEQFLDFLRSLSEDNYCAVPAGSQYGIGRHVRHVLDLYRALKQGLLLGMVDYDDRDRGSILEKDIEAARLAIEEVLHWLQEIEKSPNTPLKIKTEVSIRLPEAAVIESSLVRELCYLSNHTTHHLAYMALLARVLGVDVSLDVGVAPTTTNYQRQATG